jgi:RNA polymerase sigma-70 factor (ECF subfamily)
MNGKYIIYKYLHAMIHSNAKGSIFPEPINTGDPTVFDLLFKTFYETYTYHSFKVVQHEQDANDIVSDMFEKLWELKKEFDNVEEFKSYLFVSIRNRSYDLLRTRQRKDERDLALLATTAISTEGLKREMTQGEVEAFFNQLLNKLPPKKRQVIQELFVHDRSTAEVAALLGITEQTVRNHKTEAINFLKKDVKDIELLLPLLLLICRN